MSWTLVSASLSLLFALGVGGPATADCCCCCCCSERTSEYQPHQEAALARCTLTRGTETKHGVFYEYKFFESRPNMQAGTHFWKFTCLPTGQNEIPPFDF